MRCPFPPFFPPSLVSAAVERVRADLPCFFDATGGFTFSGEGESMIHRAGEVFANTHIHPPTPPSSSTPQGREDEWEDTPMKGA